MQNKIAFLTLILVATYSMAVERVVHIQQTEGNCWLRPGTHCNKQKFTPTDQFARAHLQQAQFENAEFNGEQTDYFDMTGVDLEMANFKEAILNYVDLSGSKLRRADFSKVHAMGLVLNNVKEGHKINFSESQLNKLVFEKSEFTNADFSKVVGVEWRAGPRVKLWGSDFSGANLIDMEFNFVNFSSAKFLGAELKDVQFRRANLEQVDFTKSILDEVDFTGAEMENAILRCIKTKNGVKMTEAVLVHVDVMGADLTGTDLSAAYLDAIEANYCDTKLPGGMILSADTKKCEKFKAQGGCH